VVNPPGLAPACQTEAHWRPARFRTGRRPSEGRFSQN